jgi:hypothetical protein
MNISLRKLCVVFALVSVFACFLGCSKVPDPPPEAFTAEELPGAVEKAFSGKPELKELADQFVASFKAKNYPKAFEQMQKLTGQLNLSKEQALALARATLTVNTLLQQAQTAGDQNAAKVIKNYQLNK